MGKESNNKYHQLGTIEIPKNYFELDEDRKAFIALSLLEEILMQMHKLPFNVSKYDQMSEILETSIEENIKIEAYEVVAVLQDIKKIINEPFNPKLA